MVELKSIEQLLYFMKSHIHLSRYDEKFIDNIAALTTVTTNQVILFHKLIFKYRRQFAKHELFVEKLVDLPWNVKVVESSPQYTDGHLSIKDDTIYFRCPFNRSFIDEFRKLPLNNFIWNKEKRYYQAPYNIHSFKILLETANKFFSNVNFCEMSARMIDEVSQYRDLIYWQPTLVRRNGNLYIMACNETLDNALGELKLSEDESTYVALSKYGVTISSEFQKDDPKLKFMCESVTTVEHGQLESMIPWLKEMHCGVVILSGYSSINLIKKKLIDLLRDSSIEYLDTGIVEKSIRDYENPVLIKFKKNSDFMYGTNKVAKVVYLVNSTPITIK